MILNVDSQLSFQPDTPASHLPGISGIFSDTKDLQLSYAFRIYRLSAIAPFSVNPHTKPVKVLSKSHPSFAIFESCW